MREKSQRQAWLPTSEVNYRLRAVTQALCRCLERLLAGDMKLVLAFDTVEDAKRTPVETWLFDGDGADILKIRGVYCIVAGREFPSTGLPSFIQKVEIDELQDEHIWKIYRYHRLPRSNYPDPSGMQQDLSLDEKELCKQLQERTEGNPLLLSLALMAPLDAERLTQMGSDQFEQLILGWLFPSEGYEDEDLPPLPVRQAFGCMAFLSRRFNRDLFDRAVAAGYVNLRLSELSATQVWNYIKDPEKHLYTMFFVKNRPEGDVQLHDIMAELIRKHHKVIQLTDDLPDLQSLSSFVSLALSWYDEEIAKATNDEIKYILQTEQLWYLADVDSVKDLRRARGDSP
jgi:hypothetical protein